MDLTRLPSRHALINLNPRSTPRLYLANSFTLSSNNTPNQKSVAINNLLSGTPNADSAAGAIWRAVFHNVLDHGHRGLDERLLTRHADFPRYSLRKVLINLNVASTPILKISNSLPPPSNDSSNQILRTVDGLGYLRTTSRRDLHFRASDCTSSGSRGLHGLVRRPVMHSVAYNLYCIFHVSSGTSNLDLARVSRRKVLIDLDLTFRLVLKPTDGLSTSSDNTPD
mmetsp:Transcript_12500/g.19875  ORF Transcript_12500/g.19875 Transcript_12500/m.19875 type:complete len:225 (+) Transcript_12500:377-1051(+)